MTTWDSTLKTFVAGEVLTAADLNENVRDPLAALSGAWNSYTPTLGVFTQGNATMTGSYIRVGALVVFRATATLGSTSAAAVGAPTLSLPVTLTAGGVSTARFADATGSFYTAATSMGSTSVQMFVPGTNGQWNNATTTSPFTWTTGDSIALYGVYEAA